MKKNAYICSAKQVGYTTTDTYFKRIQRCSLFSDVCSTCFATKRGQRFFFHITKILRTMRNKVKFGWSANNSNRVRFYGKTVIDGKTITSKKYRDALSAMEWGKKQMNRACTGIYCITVSGAHVPMNVQFI